jgi:hypothetical protein
VTRGPLGAPFVCSEQMFGWHESQFKRTPGPPLDGGRNIPTLSPRANAKVSCNKQSNRRGIEVREITQERREVLEVLLEAGGETRGPSEVADVLGKYPHDMSRLLVAMEREGLIVRVARERYAAIPTDLKVWKAARGAPLPGAPRTGPERNKAEQLRLVMPHPTYSKSGMYVTRGRDGAVIPIELARWQRAVGTLTSEANR